VRGPYIFVLVVLAATLVAGLASEARAAPEPPRVEIAIIRPASDDEILKEAAARTGLELAAIGSPTTFVDGVAGDGFAGRIALVREDGVATIDLVGTLSDGAPLHRRVPVPASEGGDDPSVLAVRAVELLRGIRLATRVAPPPRAAPPEARPASDEVSAPAPRSGEIFRLSVGVSALERNVTGPLATPGLLLSLSAAVMRHVAIVATLAGPFFTDLSPSPEGSAHVRQALGAFGVRLDSSRERTSLHLLAATGFQHVAIDVDRRGIPAGPPPPELHIVTPHSDWQPLVMLGAGVSGRVLPWLGLAFDAAAVMSPPTLDVIVNGRTVGTVAGPSVLSSVSAWVAFP
jgi:hypothetical protein